MKNLLDLCCLRFVRNVAFALPLLLISIFTPIRVSAQEICTEAALREMGTRFEQHVANMEEKNGMEKIL